MDETVFMLVGGFINYAEPSIQSELRLVATTPLADHDKPELIMGAKYKLVKVEEGE